LHCWGTESGTWQFCLQRRHAGRTKGSDKRQCRESGSRERREGEEGSEWVMWERAPRSPHTSGPVPFVEGSLPRQRGAWSCAGPTAHERHEQRHRRKNTISTAVGGKERSGDEASDKHSWEHHDRLTSSGLRIPSSPSSPSLLP
jgi:hypothetical protein